MQKNNTQMVQQVHLGGGILNIVFCWTALLF